MGRAAATTVVLATVLCACSVAHAGTLSFGAPTVVGPGNVPRGIAAGDVSGDGKLDLVAARGDSLGGALVLLGAGDGTFSLPVQYRTAGLSVSVAIGDLDGDANPDLAVANLSGGLVSVLLGSGGGAFGAATQFASGQNPNEVALADLDGDGKLDLAVPEQSTDRLLIRLGDGAGGFGAQTGYGTGSRPGLQDDQPTSVTAGDIDGDGIPDLVAANFGSESVAVLRGVGDRSFLAPAITPLGLQTRPRTAALGDFNGDGLLDIAVAQPGEGAVGGGAVAVLLGAGGGQLAPPVAYPAGRGAVDVAVADLDGDRVLDIVTANQFATSISVLAGNGDGSFAPAQTFTGPSNPVAVTTGDFNGDGLPDLAIAAVAGNGVYVMLNHTDATAPQTTIDSGPDGPTSDDTPTFTFHADEPATFECSLDQGSPAFAACESGASFGPLADGTYTFRVRATDLAGNTQASAATREFTVDTTPDPAFDFTGFFQPVDNLPTLNLLSAGQGVAIKFSLGGDHGLNVLAEGYPKSEQVACGATAELDGIESTVSAGNGGLTYDAAADTYTYIWKTQRASEGTCHQLVLRFTDGSAHRAAFKFRR